MSKNQNTKIVINPATQRPVKFGTRVYKQLLKDNIIAEEDEDTPTKTKKQIQKIQKRKYDICNYDNDFKPKPKPKAPIIPPTKIKRVVISYDDEINKLLNDAFNSPDEISSKSKPKHKKQQVKYEESEQENEDEEDEGEEGSNEDE